jgi:hypothetical protein
MEQEVALADCPTTRAEPKKISTYNREKYEANKEKILAYRKKRYRELNAYKYDIQIIEGKFIISFD